MGRYIGSYIDGGGHPHQHLPSHPLTTPRGFIYTHKEPMSCPCLYYVYTMSIHTSTHLVYRRQEEEAVHLGLTEQV